MENDVSLGSPSSITVYSLINPFCHGILIACPDMFATTCHGMFPSHRSGASCPPQSTRPVYLQPVLLLKQADGLHLHLACGGVLRYQVSVAVRVAKLLAADVLPSGAAVAFSTVWHCSSRRLPHLQLSPVKLRYPSAISMVPFAGSSSIVHVNTTSFARN